MCVGTGADGRVCMFAARIPVSGNDFRGSSSFRRVSKRNSLDSRLSKRRIWYSSNHLRVQYSESRHGTSTRSVVLACNQSRLRCHNGGVSTVRSVGVSAMMTSSGSCKLDLVPLNFSLQPLYSSPAACRHNDHETEHARPRACVGTGADGWVCMFAARDGLQVMIFAARVKIVSSP